MINIFDLDYTLLDSKRFREECLGEFFNMTPGEFNHYYKTNYKNKGKNYSPIFQIQNENKHQEAVEEKISQLNEHFKREISKYLLPGAAENLNIFKQHLSSDDELVLASFGNKAFHEMKINNLMIGELPATEYFSRVILEDKSKSENPELLEMAGKEVTIFNDNAKESIELIKVLGEHARLVLLEGPYSKNIEHEFKIYRDLSEVVMELYPEANRELKIK